MVGSEFSADSAGSEFSAESAVGGGWGEVLWLKLQLRRWLLSWAVRSVRVCGVCEWVSEWVSVYLYIHAREQEGEGRGEEGEGREREGRERGRKRASTLGWLSRVRRGIAMPSQRLDHWSWHSLWNRKWWGCKERNTYVQFKWYGHTNVHVQLLKSGDVYNTQPWQHIHCITKRKYVRFYD